MSDEQRSQALAPFFTTRPMGTGLGLPITDRIVDAHGGMVSIDSQLDAGTTISVLLPQDPNRRLHGGKRRRISLLP